MLNLKNVLSNKIIQKELINNLFVITKLNYELDYQEFLKGINENSFKSTLYINGETYSLENTLHICKETKEYLLESRLFYDKTGEMVNAYLPIFKEDFCFKENIDDVWSYANWNTL